MTHPPITGDILWEALLKIKKLRCLWLPFVILFLQWFWQVFSSAIRAAWELFSLCKYFVAINIDRLCLVANPIFMATEEIRCFRGFLVEVVERHGGASDSVEALFLPSSPSHPLGWLPSGFRISMINLSSSQSTNWAHKCPSIVNNLFVFVLIQSCFVCFGVAPF